MTYSSLRLQALKELVRGVIPEAERHHSAPADRLVYIARSYRLILNSAFRKIESLQKILDSAELEVARLRDRESKIEKVGDAAN